MTSFDKALVALVGAVLTVVGTQPWGKVLADPSLQASVISIVTAALVYLLPNAPAPGVTAK